MPKPIDLELLELALWQAFKKAVVKPSPERPMRAPRCDDIVQVTEALKAVRNSWSLVKADKEQASFEEMKARALDGLRQDKGWDLPTRNLYSSAVAIYMIWDRAKLTIKPETRRELETIRAIGLAIQGEKHG